MSGPLISVCCGAVASEAETPDDTVKFWCGACRRDCKVTRPNQNLGTPRTAAQAYNDSFNADGTPKEEDFPQEKTSQTPLEGSQKPVEAFKIENGSIYQDGKLIGYTVDDKTWFKTEFGEDWKGSEESLKALRARA